MPSSLQSAPYAAFIEGLRGLRVQLGISQQVLADRLGRPQSFVSKTERRERRLDVMEFAEWAKALGWKPDELLTALVDA
jgi:transcriptional regulator with XRE-family HTH domain